MKYYGQLSTTINKNVHKQAYVRIVPKLGQNRISFDPEGIDRYHVLDFELRIII